ncbi:Metallo-beta-lactamase domain-containing protein 1 [Sarcoptes scabiei]|uniref:Metallo-beta-lactamase domain-containing protein 1 n=1 Tax=Sarcoptes scabiei TaxID=52283 RepID=A0A834RL09_SARSC|nr:Metallo-beta-lactamase domain-containing protein 1 [Sarcoptes scabiei]
MSVEVIVLKDGYSRWKDKPRSMLANGTSTLIRLSDGKNFLIDTLGPWDKDDLVDRLHRQNLSPENIHLLIGTHMHTDHIGNLNLFTNCPQIISDQRCFGDFFEFDIFGSNKHLTLAKDVDLISTPGHTPNDVSIICRNVDRLGTVAIVGDLFESKNDLEDERIWIDAGSFDSNQQRINRQYILSEADFIVPGHGPMFKVDRS